MTDFLASREGLWNRLEAAGFSQRRVAQEEGIDRRRIKRAIDYFELAEALGQHRNPSVKPDDHEPTIGEHASWRVKEGSLRRELQHERAINRELARNASIVEATASIVVPWMQQNLRLPYISRPIPPSGDHKPIWILLSINDNHFGAEFSLEIMGRLNAFSPSICAQRVERVCDVVRMWIANFERIGNPVAGIVVAFNGDNFNGALAHEDVNNSARVVKQAGDIATIHAQMLWELAHDVSEIICVCQVGNHTRTTKRSLNSGASAATSWETMYHWAMKAMLREVKHIKWHIERDRQTFIRICNTTWGITHGDLIKGGGGNLGFPAYGLKRHYDGSVAETVVLAKRARRLVEFDDKMSTEQRFETLMHAMAGIVDYNLIGHFHTDIRPVPGLFVMPSLMGPDPFAKDNLRRGASSPAAQRFFAIHPEQDIMGEYQIHLEHIIEDGPSRYFWGVLDEDELAPDDLFDRFVSGRPAPQK